MKTWAIVYTDTVTDKLIDKKVINLIQVVAYSHILEGAEHLRDLLSSVANINVSEHGLTERKYHILEI